MPEQLDGLLIELAIVETLKDGPLEGVALCSEIEVGLPDAARHIIGLQEAGIIGRVTHNQGNDTTSSLFLREKDLPGERRLNPFH